MLKIKDNVDLKKLEKFGFHNCDWDYEKNQQMDNPNCYGDNWYKKIIDDEHFADMYFEEKNLYCYLKSANRYIMDAIFETIYDLIKADLVEKVEDK